MRKALIIVLIVAALIGLVWGAIFYWQNLRGVGPAIKSPPENIAQNISQTDDNKNKDKSDLIRVENPKPDVLIQSPLVVNGEARGYWFFEASFPIVLLDGNGKELAQGIAQAKSDWMTENFVPFEAEIQFANPATVNGMLILKKDNPSGLPEHDDELDIPVKFFGESQGSPLAGKISCKITGCSNQICANKDVVTTCEIRPEFACYQNAVCERQASGECGWTQTAELKECLEKYKNLY